jgi:RNA polymerase sigma-70 factor (ECF subfamily)
LKVADKLIAIYPKLLRYAVGFTKQKATAEDLVMEVITKLLEASNLTEDVNIEAYAMRSIRNLFINVNKKSQRTVSEQNISGESTYDNTADPVSGNFVTSGDLEKALMGLEVKCRDILSLFAIGNTYKEIAGVLEVEIGTVMSRMARCRQHLISTMDGGKYA